MVVKGLDAVVLAAEVHNPEKRLKNYHWPFITVYWDEAPQEMKDDEKVKWWPLPNTLRDGHQKFTYVRPTEEEQKIIAENKRNALKTRTLWILKNYGYDAVEFYYTRARKEEFKNAGMEVLLDKIPKCLLESQCELTCGYFNHGMCTYKGDFNADNLQIFN